VMDPFHVVSLAGDALDATRRRVQQEIAGRRGTAKDLLYKARRTLLTGLGLITVRQGQRLDALFADEHHAPVEVAWSVYQKMISAYRHTDPAQGKRLISRLIGKIATGVPAGIEEIARLGRTLARRRADVLAYLDHPGTSNGPTEALNGRLEHLRGIAQDFRNLTHYTARSLTHTGGLRHQLAT
jgi:transposase